MTVADDLCFEGVAELAPRIRRRELSALELLDAVLKRTESVGPALNCFIGVRADAARLEAAQLDAELAAGAWRGPLHGLPVSLKDNIAVGGELTTAGSAGLRDWRPHEDAGVVRRLREAGAIVFAKANLYEFAYGAPNPAVGPTQNPWRAGFSTGGSSNGSGAAVAAGLGVASIGTDTSGSIRIPAALCGIVGLKPSYGAVSRRGVVPVSVNLDHVGPLTRTVRDCAAVLAACGMPSTLTDVDAAPARGVVAVAQLRPGESTEPEVRAGVESVAARLEHAGVALVERTLPDLALARAAAWTITGAEAAEHHHDRLRAAPDTIAPGVRTLLELGELLPATAYVRAMRVRARLTDELTAALAGVDAVLLPAIPMTKVPLGAAKIVIDAAPEPLLQAITRFTALAAVSGHPAVVLPCGATHDGHPLAAQLIGHHGDDYDLLRIARVYERETDWTARRPPVAVGDPSGTAGLPGVGLSA